MKYSTYIDTLDLRISCSTQEQQHSCIRLVEDIARKGNLAVKDNIEKNYREKNIFYRNTLISGLKSGYDGKNKQFYVNIRFAGLKSYDDQTDEIRLNLLVELVKSLNDLHIQWEVREIDIALDVNSDFSDVLFVCSKKTPNTKYFGLDEKQQYDTTKYIEEPSSNLTQIACQYDKSIKEGLDSNITRNEIKCKQKCLSEAKGINKLMDRLKGVVERYKVLYFESKEEKNHMLSQLSKSQSITKRLQKKLKLDSYAISFDIQEVEEFLKNLFNIKTVVKQDNKRTSSYNMYIPNKVQKNTKPTLYGIVTSKLKGFYTYINSKKSRSISMKKDQKTNRINFRCSNEEWAFYQSLKGSGLTISSFISSIIKTTKRYKKFDNLINGGY